MRLRMTKAVISLTLGVSAFHLAFAQDAGSRSESIMRCSTGKPDVVAAILACTKIIADRHLDDAVQLAALRNRGAFYSQRGDPDHAIAD